MQRSTSGMAFALGRYRGTMRMTSQLKLWVRSIVLQSLCATSQRPRELGLHSCHVATDIASIGEAGQQFSMRLSRCRGNGGESRIQQLG
jgi:hypothetical protein